MGIYIEPSTRQRIPFMNHSGDFTFDLSGDEAIVTEDVPVVGSYDDWTGTGGLPSRTQQMFASSENSLDGTDAQIEGKAKVPNLNVHGVREGTHRLRVKKVYNGNTNHT